MRGSVSGYIDSRLLHHLHGARIQAVDFNTGAVCLYTGMLFQKTLGHL
jgi:hypothetical protein